MHSYERDYPVYQGQLESTSYVDPRATVHHLVGGAGNDEQRDSKRRSRIRRALRGGSSSEDEEVEEEEDLEDIYQLKTKLNKYKQKVKKYKELLKKKDLQIDHLKKGFGAQYDGAVTLSEKGEMVIFDDASSTLET